MVQGVADHLGPHLTIPTPSPSSFCVLADRRYNVADLADHGNSHTTFHTLKHDVVGIIFYESTCHNVLPPIIQFTQNTQNTGFPRANRHAAAILNMLLILYAQGSSITEKSSASITHQYGCVYTDLAGAHRASSQRPPVVEPALVLDGGGGGGGGVNSLLKPRAAIRVAMESMSSTVVLRLFL